MARDNSLNVCFIVIIGFVICFGAQVDGDPVPSQHNSNEKCVHVFKNVNDEVNFQKQLSDIPSCRQSLSIKLEHSNLLTLPNNSLSNVITMNFTLDLHNTSLSLLAPKLPGYLPFNGMRFRRGIIRISNSKSMVGWRWDLLKDLPGKLKFYALNSELIYLHSSFGNVAQSRVTDVKILKCGLRWLGERVFSKFSALTNLDLRANKLERIERSHLPDKAPEFKEMDLGKNRLTFIPSDLCEDLPLERIYLGGNNIANYKIREVLCVIRFPVAIESPPEYPVACNCSEARENKNNRSISEQWCYDIDEQLVPIETFRTTCIDNQDK